MTLSKLLNKRIIMILLVLPFLEPFGTEDMGRYIGGFWAYLHSGFILLKWISFLVIALVFFVKYRRLSKIVLLLGIYQAWILVVSVFYGEMTFAKLSTIATAVGLALLFEYYIRFGNIQKFLRIVESILLCWIVVNLLSLIVYRDGMYVDSRFWTDNWILGYKNRHIYYYLPFLTISAISQYIRYKRLTLRYLLVIAGIVFSSILSRSTTTTIATVLFAGLVLVMGTWNIPKVYNFTSVYIFSVVISGLIILAGFQSYFATFIRDILGKDVTFTSRTLIWARALIDFLDNPVCGNGLISYTNIFKTWNVSQMHNLYLDILVTGGIILGVLFTFIIMYVSKKHLECDIPLLKNMTLFCFTAYCVLFIMEARRDMALLYMFFIVTAYLPSIAKKYNLPSDYRRLIRIKLFKK